MKHILRNTLLVLAATIGITVIAQTTVSDTSATNATTVIAAGDAGMKVTTGKNGALTLAEISKTPEVILVEDMVTSVGLVNIAVISSTETADRAIAKLNTHKGTSYAPMPAETGQTFLKDHQRLIEIWNSKNAMTKETVIQLSFIPVSRAPTQISQTDDKKIASAKDTSSNGTTGSSGGSSPNGTN